MEYKTGKRIDWVDVAKGIGVYLVILGHLWYVCIPQIINQAVYAFHMPMFFVLSGFVFVKKTHTSFLGYITPKIMRLIVPATIYICFFALVYLSKWKELEFHTLIDELFFFHGKCLFNDPCWFFISLFQIYILMFLLRIHHLGLKAKIVLMLFFAFGGYIIYTYDILPYFGIDRTIIASVFFIMGIIIRGIYDKGNITKVGHILLLLISLVLFIIFGLIVNKKVSFYDRNLGNYFAFLISGMTGTVCFIYASIIVSNIKNWAYLKTVGKNSLFIIGTHFLGISLFRTLGRLTNTTHTWYISIMAIIYTVLLVEVYRHICCFIDAHFPFITGKVKYERLQ